MRLLQVDHCASYPLARAGGHRTIHGLLKHTAALPGHACLSIAPRRGQGSQSPEYDPRLADFGPLGIRRLDVGPDRWVFDCDYPAWAVEDVEEAFDEAVESFRPDVVWSNSFRATPLLGRARDLGIAAVWYVHDCRPEPGDLRRAAESGVEMIAASCFLGERVRRLTGGTCLPVYPLISEDEYLVDPDAERHVTFINPHPHKGYETFLGIPGLLPDVSFLVVEGWPLGERLPAVEARLATFPNVRFLRQQADARAIYRRTRLLLVPSIVEEGGPRVIREAQLNGIPVLGSPRGGIPEMLGDGGLIIGDYEDPTAWAEAVRGIVDHPDVRESLARAASRNARRSDLQTQTILGQFLSACDRARARASLARMR